MACLPARLPACLPTHQPALASALACLPRRPLPRREVCSRGGYKVGNGINWKGQVFPRMRNFTAHHKMTGVGNALKRHYQVFLLEYEQVEAVAGAGGREMRLGWEAVLSCGCGCGGVGWTGRQGGGGREMEACGRAAAPSCRSVSMSCHHPPPTHTHAHPPPPAGPPRGRDGRPLRHLRARRRARRRLAVLRHVRLLGALLLRHAAGQG